MAATLEITGRPAGGGRPVLGPREATTRFFADQITVRHEGEVLDAWEAHVLAGCEPPAYTHFRLRDALSGVARLTVAGKACWKVAQYDRQESVVVGQTERTKVVACYIPKGATRVTATVVDVAGNAATKTLVIR
jgi:hypothetical protein